MGWHTFLHSWTFMHEELMTSHKVLSLRSTRSESQAFCWSRFNEHLLHVEHLVHWWIMQIRHHLFLHHIIRHGMKSNVQKSSRTWTELEQNSNRTQELEKNSCRTRAETRVQSDHSTSLVHDGSHYRIGIWWRKFEPGSDKRLLNKLIKQTFNWRKKYFFL